jgi:hypothetical protein
MLKKQEKKCFLVSCGKTSTREVAEVGQNFTKFGKYLQIFFLKFMHKKRMNFADETKNNADCISY